MRVHARSTGTAAALYRAHVTLVAHVQVHVWRLLGAVRCLARPATDIVLEERHAH